MSTAIELSNRKIVASAKTQFEASNDQMNFIKEAGFAIQILNNNPYLAKCDQNSIRDAVVNVALCGLTLNPALKMAYLVPRKVGGQMKCVLDPSYMGLIKVVTDAGAVKNIDAGVVYENENFEYQKGDKPFLRHSPLMANRGQVIGAYAIAYFRDGGSQFEVLAREDIEKVRGTSESYKSEKGRKFSPWVTWKEEMFKKTAIKRLYKILPKTIFTENLIAALNTEYQNEQDDLAPKPDNYAEIFDEETAVVQEPEEPEVQEAQVVHETAEHPLTPSQSVKPKQPTQDEMNKMREEALIGEK